MNDDNSFLLPDYDSDDSDDCNCLCISIVNITCQSITTTCPFSRR